MIEVILAVVSTIFAAVVGTGGVLFYKQNKRLKAAEAAAAEKDVLSKDLENQKSTNDEWIRLYNESKSELAQSQSKISLLQNKLQAATEINNNSRLLINDLTWSKCIVNGCDKRKPPRDFEKKFIENQNLHTVVTQAIPCFHDDVEIDEASCEEL